MKKMKKKMKMKILQYGKRGIGKTAVDFESLPKEAKDRIIDTSPLATRKTNAEIRRIARSERAKNAAATRRYHQREKKRRELLQALSPDALASQIFESMVLLREKNFLDYDQVAQSITEHFLADKTKKQIDQMNLENTRILISCLELLRLRTQDGAFTPTNPERL